MYGPELDTARRNLAAAAAAGAKTAVVLPGTPSSARCAYVVANALIQETPALAGLLFILSGGDLVFRAESNKPLA